MITSFSPVTSVKGMQILRKSQPQCQEKLGKLRLRQKSDFLRKKTCINEQGMLIAWIVLYKAARSIH